MEEREPTREELLERIRALEERLLEADQTIEAIQSGEVDALVVQRPDGEQLYTLTGADHGYRVLVESMTEGALMLSSDDSIYYCNQTLAEMLGVPIQKIIGTKPDFYVTAEDRAQLTELIRQSRGLGAAKAEFLMKRDDGTLLSVNVSLNRMSVGEFEGVCAIITDLSGQKQIEEELRRHRAELELLVDERTAELARINNELRVQHIELEMQNEELRRVQNDLEESRLRYSDLYDLAPVGYLTLNNNGQIVDLNLTATRQLGVERGHLLNRNIQNYIIQPDKQAFFSHIKTIFDKRERQIAVVRFSPEGGEQFYGRLESIYMEGEKGVGLCRTNVIDVTLSKRAEEELRKSRDDLEVRVQERTKELLEANQALSEKAEVIDLVRDAIIACDLESRVTFWSRGAEETYGFTRDEALGKVSSNLLKTEFPGATENIVKTVLEKGEWKGELKHTRANGERIIVDSRCAVQGSKKGEAWGVVEVNRDITASKILAEEFRRADRAFRTLSESNQAMVRHTKAEMELLQEVCQIVVGIGGYRMAWVGFAENDEDKTVHPVVSAGCGQGYLGLAQISWADNERGKGPTGTAIRTGEIITSQNALLNPTYGPWRAEATKRGYASSIALPLIVERHIIGALTIYASEPDAFDEGEAGLLSRLAENVAFGISSLRIAEQRRRSEEELKTYASRLEITNKELQDFAFVAAHDLQEPLRKIQTFGHLAMKRCGPALDNTGQEYFERVFNSAGRMRQLLQDLLTFSRAAGRTEPFQKLELGKIVREAVDIFEVSLMETDCRIEIEDLPAIEADESQMVQLFQNLIGNALKYRGSDTPYVKVYGKIEGEECEFCVEDNGIGFDPQFADRIFKPFQRLHARYKYEGTGMGLAICRKIVERHSGTIRAESELGKGSRFIVRLPAKQTVLEAIIFG